MFANSVTKCKDAIATVSGALFAVGWWLWIDANVITNHLDNALTPKILPWYYIPGIVGTVGLVMTNIISLESLNPFSWGYDSGIGGRVRVWLFASFIVSLASISSAIWIMADKYLNANNMGSQYPGIALMVQTVLLFFSSLLLLWCRSQPDEYQEMGL